MKLWLRRTAIALCVLFLLLQLWPAGRTNPPATKPLAAPSDVLAILKRSCYDCHSNETHWPWYAYVAPISWLVVHDVVDGREELNFSHWGDLDEHKRSSAAEQIVEEVEEGHMPLPNYLRLHADAKVTPAELEKLRAWADSVE